MSNSPAVQLSGIRKTFEGVVAVDSLDGEFTHKYGLVWKACN